MERETVTMQKIIDGVRAIATFAYHRSDKGTRRYAEEVARKIVVQANDEGLPYVEGVLLAAADMLDRVQRAVPEMGEFDGDVAEKIKALVTWEREDMT